MKRLISILFASLILLSGMHLTVASHLCCGELASVKYSFSGELAGCGMETGREPVSPQGNLHTDCCKNHVVACSADGQYFSANNIVKMAAGYSQPLCPVLSHSSVPAPVMNRSWLLSGGPPLKQPVSAVSQSFICVFII